MPPFTSHLQVPQSQRQGPECFLGRCKYPGVFSGLGAVELSVLWGSSASGAFGFPSRNPLTFSQGVCLHRPPLEYCAPSTPQWSTVGFCGKDLASQQYWDLSTGWPGLRAPNLSAPVFWASRTVEGQGLEKELVLEVSLTGCCSRRLLGCLGLWGAIETLQQVLSEKTGCSRWPGSPEC